MIINVGNIFQIALPNKFKIVQLDIPIIKYTNPSTGEVLDDQVFCTDILDILTQDFFSRKNKGVVDDTQKNSSAVEDVVVRKLLQLKTFADFLAINSTKIFNIILLTIAQVNQHPDRPGYERVSSTQQKQREHFCATIIKRCWKSSRQTSPSSAETIKDGNQLIQPPNDQRNSVALSEKEFNVDVPYIDQGSIQDLT